MSINLQIQNSHQARPVGVRDVARPNLVCMHGTLEPDRAELLVAAIAHIDVCDTYTVLSCPS
jgi:hypothetical protein